jgi:hypothetical protein
MFHTYVARVCSKYFFYVAASVFMLQVFYVEVIYVAVAIHVYCKCMSKCLNCFRRTL